MAPRRAAFAGAALATWCLLLVTAGAAPTKDGFLVPLASNDAWDYYEFNFSSKVTITSVTPFNSSRGGKDMNVAGSVITSTAEVYGPKGEVVGIYQLLRHVVGAAYDIPGMKGMRAVTSMLIINYEFGKPEHGYFDDAGLVTNIVTKRYLGPRPSQATVDYDGVISGGTGRFLGATGSLVNTPTVVDKSTLTALTSDTQFRVWVPRNLPTPKGPISGRRRSL